MTDSELLIQKINIFKKKYLNSRSYFIYVPNKFDLFIDKVINISLKNNKLFMLKKASSYFLDLLLKVNKYLFTEKIFASQQSKKKIEILEKKIDFQNQMIKKYFQNNNKMKDDILKLNANINDLFKHKNSAPDNANNQNNFNPIIPNTNQEKSKLEFYQNENLRMSGELLEIKKKYQIIKQELEKNTMQRKLVIDRINNVNEVLSENNIVTSVFNNNIQNEVKKVITVDNNKKKINLDEEISKIFLSK